MLAMSQGIFILTLLAIFEQLMTVTSEDQYADLDVGYRPMPSDIAIEIQNKTEYELKMEECMTDYVLCKRTIGNRETPICGDSYNFQKKVFKSLCDLTYEVCKEYEADPNRWRYLHDGDC